MIEGLTAGAVLKMLAGTAVGAKLVAFLTSSLFSPTNPGIRKMLIEHAEEILNKTSNRGVISNNACVAMWTHVDTLREGVESGWTEPRHTYAFCAVLKFLSWEHARGLQNGASKFTMSHLNASGAWMKDQTMSAYDVIMKLIAPEDKNRK